MIYLDSAATTFQKPQTVEQAMRTAIRTCASPGRGGYEAAERAERIVYGCRSKLAELFGVENMENIVFTLNATHALNIAIKSLVATGGKVVVSGFEHNAVMRPLTTIGNVKLTVAKSPPFRSEQCLHEFRNAISRDTSAVICNHVSNVFGCVQPVEQIADICRTMNIPFIIDASQSAGVLPINMKTLGAAFIAMPGHKGLYGPQGTGVLLCNHETKTLIEGGTGSMSLLSQMPDFLPDRLEAGTHNVPGIAGLGAGVDFIKKYGTGRIAEHEKALTMLAAAKLEKLPSVELFSSDDWSNHTGVISFRVQNMDCETVASALGNHGIAVRAGYHCAPQAHSSGGTIDTGTVRLSTSAFNKKEEITYFIDVLREITAVKH